MSKPDRLDRVYNVILKRMVATGQAPHYTEIAAEADVPVEEGRKALHELIDAGIPAMWLYPETDYHLQFCAVQQPPDAIPDQRRWCAEVVRPVRIRIAGGQLALPGESDPDRRPVPRLRHAIAYRDEGRSGFERRAERDYGIRRCSILKVVSALSLCLKHHEPLPVGRAHPKLVPVRCRCGTGHRPARGSGQAVLA